MSVKTFKEVQKGLQRKAVKKNHKAKVDRAKGIVATVKKNKAFIDQADKSTDKLYASFYDPKKVFSASSIKEVVSSLSKMSKLVEARYQKALLDLHSVIGLELPSSKIIAQISDLSHLKGKLAMLQVNAKASLGEEISIDSNGFVVDATEEIALSETADSDVVSEEMEASETAEDVIAEGEIAEGEIAEGEIAEGEIAEGETAEDVTAEGETAEDVTAEGETVDTISEEVEDLDNLVEDEEDTLVTEDEVTDIEDIEFTDQGIDDAISDEILNEEDMEELEEEEVQATASVKAKKINTAKKTKTASLKCDDGINQLFEGMI
jgi:hypothetical protein